MSEISGVLKNAMERGWKLDEIRRSLINSGYSEQEVDGEITIFNNQSQPFVNRQDETQQTQKLSSFQIPLVKKDNKKTIIIVLVALIILTLIGAGLTWFLLR